jgi:preprotein translocase SecE subunit
LAETTKKRKRIVKNPESFRERALKASETSDKPKARTRAKKGIGRILAKIFGPIGRLLKSIFKHQPFKFIGKVLAIVGRVLLPKYIRDSWKELKLVTWPNLRTSRQLTTAVLIFAIIFGVAIASIDWVLDKVFREILLK